MITEIKKRLEVIKQSRKYDDMSNDAVIDNLLDIVGALLEKMEQINNAIFEIVNGYDV